MERRDCFELSDLLCWPALRELPRIRVQRSRTPFESVWKQGTRMVLDLTGRWQLQHGRSRCWCQERLVCEAAPSFEARRFDVVVPSVWQQYLELQGGVGWYYKDLQIPQDLIGKVLRLHFEAVDYRARVWFNGEEVGSHDGGFTPFELDVSRVAKAGTNRLAVRVSDVGRDFRTAYCGLPGWEKTRNGTVDGLSFAEIPAGFQDWREGFDHGGIWQPVNLIATEPVYVAGSVPGSERGQRLR